MKVLTWNIYKKNKSFEQARKFIVSGNYDVVCLQEVPIEETPKFLELFPHGLIAEEYLEFKSKNRADKLNLLILSKLPITNSGVVRHARNERTKRYKDFFVDFQYIDVSSGGRQFRIFNCHLMCVASPSYRLSQLQEMLEHSPNDERHIVLCGDFNTFGMPFVNFFVAWYFMYKSGEWRIAEKKIFENQFKVSKLKNIFKGRRTFSLFPLQLDYILLPEEISLKEKRVHTLAHGSDHYPIEVTLAAA